MVDGNFDTVRVGTPSGGVLYFVQAGADQGNGYAIYQSSGGALQFRSGPAGYVLKNYTNVTRVTIADGGQMTLTPNDNKPLILQAGLSDNTYSSAIQFNRYDGYNTWLLGASIANGTQQQFGLMDLLAGSAVRLLVDANGNIGVGVESFYTGGEGHLIAFSRPANLYQPLHLDGSALLLNANSRANVRIGPFNVGASLAVETNDANSNANLATFSHSNGTTGVGIGFQSVRQTIDGHPLELNAGGAGVIHIGNVSSGGATLALGGGNVGVGRADPQAKLHVAGTILADGNFGIGTTTPGARLSIETSNVDPNANMATFSHSNGSTGIGIGFQGVRQTIAGHPLELNAGGNGMVNIGNVSTGGVTLAYGGGNVGIGTASPQAKLHVVGAFVAGGNVGIGITNPQAPLQVGSASVFSAGQVRIGANNGVNAREWDIGPRIGVTPPYSFAITDASETGAPARLVIRADASGNVGIGTTNPQAKLDIVGPTTPNATALRVSGPSAGQGYTVIISGSVSIQGSGALDVAGNIQAPKVFGGVYG